MCYIYGIDWIYMIKLSFAQHITGELDYDYTNRNKEMIFQMDHNFSNGCFYRVLQAHNLFYT